MARLFVIKGADEGKQFDLAGPRLGIGREAGNAIRLHDTEISRRHAELREVENGGYALADIGSANGTFVNNQRVKEAVLRAGDHILVGQTTLVYSAGRGESQAAADDLAERISLITRHDLELSSAIVKTVSEGEGSRLLTQPDKVKTPWLKTALANLTIMYEASQAISHILDLGELLNRILELIFRSIEADRGCVMLRKEGGDLEPKALRWRKEVDDQEKIDVSRTIVEYVLTEKQGVLVSDASQDERFSTGQSIVRFGIREVICVPMKGRHETLGVLYLDTRSTARDVVTHNDPRGGKFTEDHLALASAIAHQAALAVEETQYYQAMVQSERLAAIGQTIAALSHHIKNILQALNSGSEILEMGLKEKDDALMQQGWRMAAKAQRKISDLVMDMLSYSKEREPAVALTDLNALVGDVAELMDGRAKELGIRFSSDLDPNFPPIQVDAEGIHRALMNIVGNAFDAVDGRKSPQVTIGTRRDPEAGWVRLVVLDNGIGIPPEKIQDIFRPFISSKGSKGTGLGLAVSRKILREHGGDIIVQSQIGKVTRFILRLPIKSPLSIDMTGSSSELPIFPPPEPD
ncbi:MAG: GAF domain-containing protein [Gemmataceae bacterium]|nr:GAF domain-containing protein [Gemmataceae bacterium]